MTTEKRLTYDETVKLGLNFDDTEKEARKYKCSACRKTFDIWDFQEDFTFDKYIGYGSKNDEHHIRFHLCCDCFDKIFDVIKPMIKDIEIEEYNEFEMAGYKVIDLEKNPEEAEKMRKWAEEKLKELTKDKK